MTKFWVLAFLAILGFQSQAQIQDPCEIPLAMGENVAATRFWVSSLGCAVWVFPRQKPEMRFREYWLDQRGRLNVFTSTPGDDMSKVTGSRTYFLFPRLEVPTFQLLDDGTVSVTLNTGGQAIFSKDARPISFPGEFVESPEINLENNGGFEIKSFEGIRLDAGWKIGTEAHKDPNGHSVFSDAHNQTCEIQNDEFFLYYEEGEPILRYSDDKSLAEFLQGRCPNLDLSPIL